MVRGQIVSSIEGGLTVGSIPREAWPNIAMLILLLELEHLLHRVCQSVDALADVSVFSATHVSRIGR